MSLDPEIRESLCLPAVCAPMFLVSSPLLVSEACKAGIIGGLPRQNARHLEEFEAWLAQIHRDLRAYAENSPGARVGPIAVNLPTKLPFQEMKENLDICDRYGVKIIISSAGNPRELAVCVHDHGGKIFHDVTNLRFAEKAIEAGVDGLTAIGAGGGGHSGTISHLALIPRLRRIFDGTIIMAGAVSSGAAIRAAEILGADLAYLGTRFIATKESGAPDNFKELLISQGSQDLMYTGKIAGVPANWMVASMRRVGLDPERLPEPTGTKLHHDHLPSNVEPWKNLWSCGQGIDLIDDLPTVHELVSRLREEYVAACEVRSMVETARLLEGAVDPQSQIQ